MARMGNEPMSQDEDEDDLNSVESFKYQMFTCEDGKQYELESSPSEASSSRSGASSSRSGAFSSRSKKSRVGDPTKGLSVFQPIAEATESRIQAEKEKEKERELAISKRMEMAQEHEMRMLRERAKIETDRAKSERERRAFESNALLQLMQTIQNGQRAFMLSQQEQQQKFMRELFERQNKT